MDDKEMREEEARLLSAARETNYAYWAALLTVDGILMSIFSVAVVAGVANGAVVRAVILVLVVSAGLSALLMVSNFRQAALLYRSLGPLIRGDENALDPEHLREQMETAARAHERLIRRECLAQKLLCIQLFIIAALVVWP